MDIQEALDKAQAITKQMSGLAGYKKDKICPHPLYDLSIDMADQIGNHAVKGKFPSKLFANRSPNQTEAEAKYIKENFKQYTLPVFIDYSNTVSRIFADNNWHIEYGEDEEDFSASGEDYQTYVESQVPIYGSVENFIKFILPTYKSIDANSFIAVRPKEIPLIKQDGSEDYIIDPSKRYDPTIFYFPSASVISFEIGKYYLFLSSLRSNVTFNNKIENTGLVFEFYTDAGVIFIEQTGKKSDFQFIVRPFFEYKTIPVIQMKGIPMLIGESILWQSPFVYAVEILDTILMNENWLQAAINKCVYPHTVMYGSPCEFQDKDGIPCDNGTIVIDGIQKTCPSCQGSGLKSRLSPLGTMLINPKSRVSDGDSALSQDPLKFVSPDVTSLEFIRDKNDRDEAKARKILHLQTSNSTVKGSENMTATGMSIDVKTMYSFIKPISDQIFEIYEFVLNQIGEQRYGDTFTAPKLNYPKSFDFKTPEDYLQEISDSIKNNLPPSFVQYVLMKYIDSIYGDNEKTIKIFRIVQFSDRLFGASQEEIAMKMAKGTVAKWEDILHTSAVTFIGELINEDSKFLDKDLKDQSDAVIKKAKEKESELSQNLTNNIYSATAAPATA